MAHFTHLLMVALAVGCVFTDARRPPPRKFPPPSPSPPPPPPPPASFEFPHTCKPGNIVPYGEGAGVDCTPYVLMRTPSVGGWTFTFTSRTPPKTCRQNCRTMALGDLKFAINPACRGTVANPITISEKSGATYSVAPNYGNDIDDGYASDEDAPARTFRIKFKKSYSVAQADGLKVSFRALAGQYGCDSATQFFNTKHGLPSDVAQYAYYSTDKKCCGTSVARL